MLGRMARILALLRTHPGGLTTEQLLDRVGYGDAARGSRMRTLNRDLAALAADGWRIDTLPTENTPAVRILRTVDNRFATLFTPAQRAQLARAAACAGSRIVDALADDLGRSDEPAPFVATGIDGLGRLAVCQAAAADRCLLRFTYNGTPRTAHPVRVLLRPGGWYLRALDSGDGIVKQFAIDRMRHLVRGKPGTAHAPADTRDEPVWDLMRIRAHDPIEVTVSTSEEFLPDVLSALAANGHDIVDATDPGRIQLRVTVTNTDVLLVRILTLGTRVRLLDPPHVRGLLRQRLVAVGGRA